jgi:hypothetical protein
MAASVGVDHAEDMPGGFTRGEAAAGSAIRSRIGRDGLAIIALRLSQRVCFQRRANAVFRACASILTHVYLRIAATGMKEVAACLGARNEPPHGGVSTTFRSYLGGLLGMSRPRFLLVKRVRRPSAQMSKIHNLRVRRSD